MSCYTTVPNETNNHRNDILTANEAKYLLKCGLSTVYDLFNEGELKGFRLKTSGKRNGIRIFANSIDALMARNANRAKAAPVGEPVPNSAPPPAAPRRTNTVIPQQAVQGLRHLRLTQSSQQEAPAPVHRRH